MPNATGHFVLVSDTSKIGCGAALYWKQKGKYHLIAYYSKKLPEAVERYSISELELTGVMANVVAFKHLLRNAIFHVYCDHSALVHILKVKREPPTLRLKKLIENLSEYKFDIYFLKGKEMHISDFLSRNPDAPNEIIPIGFMLRELEQPDFPENFLYLKEEVDALPEQENYEPYHVNDFMFIFSNDSHENMSMLSNIYSTEYTRIETLNVCTEEKNQLHDILNIMTRSMAKTKQADVPSIYPLKGEHKKPEHAKQVNIDKEVHEPNRNVPEVEEIPEVSQEVPLEIPDEVPLPVQEQEMPIQKPPLLVIRRSPWTNMRLILNKVASDNIADLFPSDWAPKPCFSDIQEKHFKVLSEVMTAMFYQCGILQDYDVLAIQGYEQFLKALYHHMVLGNVTLHQLGHFLILMTYVSFCRIGHYTDYMR